MLELSPQFHSPTLILASDPRRKMNSARTRNCRGTPRPPHGLYVGDLLMQLDSTQSLQRDYIAIYRPNSTHATTPASSPRTHAHTHSPGDPASSRLEQQTLRETRSWSLPTRQVAPPSCCCQSPRLDLLCFRRARRTRARHGPKHGHTCSVLSWLATRPNTSPHSRTQSPCTTNSSSRCPDWPERACPPPFCPGTWPHRRSDSVSSMARTWARTLAPMDSRHTLDYDTNKPNNLNAMNACTHTRTRRARTTHATQTRHAMQLNTFRSQSWVQDLPNSFTVELELSWLQLNNELSAVCFCCSTQASSL